MYLFEEFLSRRPTKRWFWLPGKFRAGSKWLKHFLQHRPGQNRVMKQVAPRVTIHVTPLSFLLSKGDNTRYSSVFFAIQGWWYTVLLCLFRYPRMMTHGTSLSFSLSKGDATRCSSVVFPIQAWWYTHLEFDLCEDQNFVNQVNQMYLIDQTMNYA
jgi:hypothetical protein